MRCLKRGYNLKMKTNDKYNCYENWEHLSTYFQTDAMFETWLMETRNIYPNDKLDANIYLAF
jgi:hypothetical protein